MDQGNNPHHQQAPVQNVQHCKSLSSLQNKPNDPKILDQKVEQGRETKCNCLCSQMGFLNQLKNALEPTIKQNAVLSIEYLTNNFTQLGNFYQQQNNQILNIYFQNINVKIEEITNQMKKCSRKVRKVEKKLHLIRQRYSRSRQKQGRRKESSDRQSNKKSHLQKSQINNSVLRKPKIRNIHFDTESNQDEQKTDLRRRQRFIDSEKQSGYKSKQEQQNYYIYLQMLNKEEYQVRSIKQNLQNNQVIQGKQNIKEKQKKQPKQVDELNQINWVVEQNQQDQ